jgi:general secretion pathway protein G
MNEKETGFEMKTEFRVRSFAMSGRNAMRLGFTLVELLLVLVILAVLAAVVVPKFVNRPEQAKQTAAKADATMIENQLEQFSVDVGRYPTPEEGLAVLVDGEALKGWKGPYLKDLPKDPWGHPYLYANPGTHHVKGIDVWSAGPNGNDGDDDDIGNWTVEK